MSFFNSEDLEKRNEAVGDNPPPAGGPYTFVVDSINEQVNRDKEVVFLKVRCRVVDGEHEGKTVTHDFGLKYKQSLASFLSSQFTDDQLKAIDLVDSKRIVIKQSGKATALKWVGVFFSADVWTKKGSGKYADKAQLAGFAEAEGYGTLGETLASKSEGTVSV